MAITKRSIISIGTDIEFAFAKNGLFYPAHYVTKKDTAGIYGTDGCDRIMEIRPKPALTPRQLYLNTQLALQECYNGLPEFARKFQWFAGPQLYDYGLGLHLHCT